MKTIKIILLLILAFIVKNNYAQDNYENIIDSLKNEYLKANSDSLKIIKLLQISKISLEFKESINYINEAIKIAKQTNYNKLYSKCLQQKSIILYRLEQYDSSKTILHQNIAFCEANNLSEELAYGYMYLGIFANVDNNQTEMWKYYKLALNYFTENNVLEGMIKIYQYMGESSAIVGQYQSAYDYFKKAIKLAIDNNENLFEASSYSLYSLVKLIETESEKDTNKIKKLILESIQFAEYSDSIFYKEKIVTNYQKFIFNNAKTLAHDYCILARIEDKNQEYLQKAKKYIDYITDYYNKNNISNPELQIIKCVWLISNKQYKEAIKKLKEVELFVKDKNLSKLYNKEIYHNFSIAYSKLQEYELVYKYQKLYIENKRIFINENNTNLCSDFQSQLIADKEILDKENDKKRNEIANQSKLERTKKLTSIILIGLIFLIIIALIITNSLFKNRKIANKSHQIFLENQAKNKKLENQQKNIELQNAKIEKQRDTVVKKNNEIKSSIIYAQRIQNAAFSQDLDFKNIYKEYFKISLIQSIVTGHFYKAYKTSKYKIIALANCSENGVPGGFLSMLGLSSLKETLVQINNSDNIQPGEIISKLDLLLSNTLNKEEQDLNRDTIDISLCIIDLINKKLLFAGANQNIYLWHNHKVIELCGDIDSICSIKPYNKKYNTISTDIDVNDMIYLPTNSFCKQIGGPNSEQFGTSKLINMISNIANMPCNNQKDYLEKTIIDWINGYNQIDDITMIGIKIKSLNI
ncbi:MAG: hypothetical protein MJ211_13235 [Bacteroidales bacterium]|nr:hypothetical protein [Bacteroidales bacterium]